MSEFFWFDEIIDEDPPKPITPMKVQSAGELVWLFGTEVFAKRTGLNPDSCEVCGGNNQP